MPRQTSRGIFIPEPTQQLSLNTRVLASPEFRRASFLEKYSRFAPYFSCEECFVEGCWVGLQFSKLSNCAFCFSFRNDFVYFELSVFKCGTGTFISFSVSKIKYSGPGMVCAVFPPFD